MRQHFHRCSNLRVVSVEASEISGDRHRGSAILDELCAAKKLTRCVGLADCDVLSDGEKRELLVARATGLRERAGGASALADLGGARGREIEGLVRDLEEERAEILDSNRRLLAEATAALDARPEDAPLGTGEDVSRGNLAILSPDLQTARLDAIDRALEAMGQRNFGLCARCRGLIDLERLHAAPDTHVCAECAKSVESEE